MLTFEIEVVLAGQSEVVLPYALVFVRLSAHNQ